MAPMRGGVAEDAGSEPQIDQKRMTVAIPARLHRRVKSEAALRGVSLQQLVIEALQREIGEPVGADAPMDNNNQTRRSKGG